MDFATRDSYRKAVEALARGSHLTEVEVAKKAADMADAGSSARRAGPRLLSGVRRPPRAGEPTIEARVRPGTRLTRAYVRYPATGYVVTLVVITALAVAVPLWWSRRWGATGLGLAIVALLAVLPASDLAVALLNRMVTRILGPDHLPRCDFEEGVPTDLRTLVVVPMLLTSEADVEALVSGLEVHYLGNREGDLRFALLSDWLDAPTEQMPGDEELLASAIAGIEQLNDRHGEAEGGGARFLLLHRPRLWNEAERCWMGWERKRGKLHELNALLRGSTSTGIITGQRWSTPPADVRYVITLDADTRLPRGAVGQLVGTIAHPLNQPHFDAEVGRVTSGYGVLQPRITPTLPGDRGSSMFQRVFGGDAGIDPYSSAVSDVYQDLFQEGSFTGKGIYDVDAFEAALDNRVPENRLLSHDLFEGIFARAGLVTDIELFDEFPSSYLVSATRQHRWARGDWQLLPWILDTARDATGKRRHNPIPGFSRWKMIDNLRRTLSAPLTVATLIAAWTLPSVPAGIWTIFVVATVVIPAAWPVVAGLIPRRQGISKRSHVRDLVDDARHAVAHVTLGFTFLAHQAWLMIDAIVRTIGRMQFTRRNLLEWVTAAQAKASHDLRLVRYYRRMISAAVIALVTAAVVIVAKPGALWFAVPFLVLWLFSPLIARVVSTPVSVVASAELSTAEIESLRLTARRTWLFFETFVGAADNWLPPDNFQDDPVPVVAHRTSPTNIGMYLLSTVTARDLGWIGTVDMVERLEQTLTTIDKLEQFNGHLYNWYGTRDMQPLEPAYVSSVDSGNLAGHLLTVSNACRLMIDQPLPIAAALTGIGDNITLTRRATGAIGDDHRSQTLGVRHLVEALQQSADSDSVPTAPKEWAGRLEELTDYTHTLLDVASTLAEQRGDGADSELVTWAQASSAAVASHSRDLCVDGPSRDRIVYDNRRTGRHVDGRGHACPTADGGGRQGR